MRTRILYWRRVLYASVYIPCQKYATCNETGRRLFSLFGHRTKTRVKLLGPRDHRLTTTHHHQRGECCDAVAESWAVG